MTRIKLCGMMRVADVEAAKRLNADFAGFILSEGFRRTIDKGTFYELSSRLTQTNVKKVGVFVNEPIENIVADFDEMLELIQLHGSEDEAYIRRLRSYTDKPIIKAFKIQTGEDVSAACESTADFILLDSGTGTGKTFDHSLIGRIERPFFLAGGLDAENVGRAIDAIKPFAVDASSSLETDGRKDINKMTAFVNAVRQKGQIL